MKPSNDVFLLIKSLTKSEKRYFKRFCKLYSTNRQNNYLKLFVAIDKQKIYHEESIKKEFKNENFIKQLNVLKHYLFRLILKSLRLYYETMFTEISLRETAIEVDILGKKQLYAQADKLLNGIISKTKAEEDCTLLLELYRLKRKLLFTLNKKTIVQDTERIIKLECSIMNQISQYNDNMLTEIKIESIFSKSGLALDLRDFNKNLHDGVKELIDEFKYSKNQDNDLFMNRFIIQRNLIRFYNFSGKFEKAYGCSNKLIQLFNKNSIFKTKNVIQYCGVLFTHIFILIRIGKLNLASEQIKELSKNLNNKYIKNSFNQYKKLLLAVVELNLYINNILGVPGKILHIAEFEKILLKETNEQELDRIKTLHLLIAINYVITCEYNKGLFWINRLLNKFDNSLALNVEIQARVVASVIHFEIENYEYLEKCVESFTRYFNSNNYQNSIELNFIKLLRNVSLSANKHEHRDLFEQMKRRISKESVSSETDFTFAEFNIYAWLESKIYKKPLLKIIQEKARKYVD